MPARTPRLRRSLGVAHLGIVGHLGRERLGGLGGGVGHVLARHVGFIDARLRVIRVGALSVVAGLLLAAVLLSLLAFLLVRLGTAILAHVERIEEIVDGIAEARLLLDEPLQPVKIASGPIL